MSNITFIPTDFHHSEQATSLRRIIAAMQQRDADPIQIAALEDRLHEMTSTERRRPSSPSMRMACWQPLSQVAVRVVQQMAQRRAA